MLILAIDSATPAASVALLEGETLLYEQYMDYRKTHSETLMIMVEQALKSCRRLVADLELVAVSAGPGSFTGLRIGMAAAKGLSLSTGIPIAGVSTLQALAFNAGVVEGLVCPLLDARKNEVYAGMYDNSSGQPRLVGQEQAVGTAELANWAEESLATAGQQKLYCLGSGVRHCRDSLENRLNGRLFQVPPHLMSPRASAVGVLAGRRASSSSFDDVYSLEPAYIRKSEAEYRLEAKEGR